MKRNLPPVVKVAERLLLLVETAVRGFPRFHKYTFGADLRKLAMKIAMLSHRAWTEPELLTTLLSNLSRAVDQMKLSLQLGSRLRAFSSLGQFEELSRTAADLGKQVGGWKKRNSNKHTNGQNAPLPDAVQRPKTLSSRSASIREARA